MALAVPVVLAVGVVALVVVGDEVVQGEAVVAGHEVDRGQRAAPVVLVEVGGAGEPGGELGERARFAPPQVAHGVAVLAVPLGPQRREVAHLVAALAHVPRLRDQLHLRDHRVLLHQVEERRQPVHLVELPGQGRREVEAEPVDVHLGDPVPQRVHDHLEDVRGPHEQGVPGARRVHVVAGVVGQTVVRRVVDALEGQRRAQVVALGGVVVDDVEDDLDPGLVQGLHRRLELQHLLAAVAPGGVGVVRGEEPDGVVAPVVVQAHVHQAVVVDELVDRHQLQRRHAEFGQVLDHRGVGQTRVGAAQLLGQPRMAHGETLDVGLVDHRVVVLRPGRPVVAPVEVRVDHDRRHRVRGGVQVIAPVGRVEVVAVHLLAPPDRPADRTRVRVEQQFRRIAAQPPLGGVRPVDTEAVPLSRHDAGQVRVPYERVALAQFDRRFGAVVVQQTQLHSVRGLREDREVRAGAVVRGTEGIRLARPDLHGHDSSRCTAPVGAPWPECRRVAPPGRSCRTVCRAGAPRSPHRRRLPPEASPPAPPRPRHGRNLCAPPVTSSTSAGHA